MPNNKRHTLKQVKKKTLKIHPSSRKAIQLQRISLRNDRLKRDKIKRYKEAIQPTVDKLLWFKFALDDTLSCATKPEVHELIEFYISRNDEEILKLEEFNKNNNSHKPKSSRQNFLEALKSKEKREHQTGFEIPDLLDPKNVKLLREWDGDPNSLSRIKLIHIQDPNNLGIITQKKNL